jgi:hypothetical protein
MSLCQEPRPLELPGASRRAEYRYYVPSDLTISEVVFGANCGPAALAASLSMEVADIMRYLPHFEDETKRYTNLTAMKAALNAAEVSFEVRRNEFPSRGLALIQWTGPWTQKQFFSRWSLRYTHWVAVDGDMIYDIHNGFWQHQDEWARDVVPDYLAELPQAADWAVKYGIELLKSSSIWQESFLGLLFRRPDRILSK